MDVFDACTYKFSPIKYRGEVPAPKGRQGAAALALDKYTMVIIGGSYQPGYLDAETVPFNESVIIFDTESHNWRMLPSKNSQQQQPVPWNLVYCSLIKLDS